MKSTKNLTKLAATASALTILSGCGGGSSSVQGEPPIITAPLTCDESIAANFRPDDHTKVVKVQKIKTGDPIDRGVFNNQSSPSPADLCLVKLVVGPGNSGPAAAPSTSAGIGIEVWLPEKGKWNNRLHAIGNGGWSGSDEANPDKLSGQSIHNSNLEFGTAAFIAATEGAVTVSTDGGHHSSSALPFFDGSWTLNPDGKINEVLLKDFSYRANHEQVIKAKALATAYYGTAPKYTYWDGGSGGGRQGLKQAQMYPEDYDGIVVGFPAVNWTRFFTSQVYPSIVVARDLAGKGITSEQANFVSRAAINACDIVGGQHLGFILDEAACTYDPTKDAAVLCGTDGGTNSTNSCVTKAQAQAINKAWYGMTSDGSVPDPAVDNGKGPKLSANQRWYGLSRNNAVNLSGTTLDLFNHQIALTLQDPSIAGPLFQNASGNGLSGYQKMTYAQLNDAFDRGVALNETAFSGINSDDPDLSKFKARGGKVIHWHGTADPLITHSGSVNYFERVLAKMGGSDTVNSFYRFYLIAGLGHEASNGTSNPNANPPAPGLTQMYDALTDWVEKGVSPDGMVFQSKAGTSSGKSLPACAYPKKVTYMSGDIHLASSYSCK